MNFLSNLFYRICQFCQLIWWYCSQLIERWKLRGAAFRQAGDVAGRRGNADDVRLVPFLLQAKAVFERMAARWSSKKWFAIRHWETIRGRYGQELLECERPDVKGVENRCKRRLGYIPKFNPFAVGCYWATLIGGGVIEFFLNSSALETGGQSEDLTRSLALILSLAFVFGVHLLGKHKAQGKSILVPLALLIGLVAGITLIREDAVAAYVKHVQESVPELGAETADPRVYVSLFFGVQALFFYVAYHLALQHHDPLLSEYHVAKMTERRIRSCKASLYSIDRRLEEMAIEFLSEWNDWQRFFDHRVMVFIEAAEVHRSEGRMAFSPLHLEAPAVVDWSRSQVGRTPPPALTAASHKEKERRI